MADKVKIRTTLRPDDEVEVSAEEATDLKRMGLVADTKATTDAGARRAVERQQSAPKKAAAPRKRTAKPAPPATPAIPVDSSSAAVPTSQEG